MPNPFVKVFSPRRKECALSLSVGKNQQRIGLMGPQDQVIDVAEINRRYLRRGNSAYLGSMQSFIEAGNKAIKLPETQKSM